MQNNVYELEFETKTADDRKFKTSHWNRETTTVHVLANGNAEKAIVKAKKHLIGRETPWYDEGENEHFEVIRDVRLITCSRLLTVDVM